jgi:NAD(P)H-dependent flavin oxidoreductase YrpB (nitropropane dioxygenase family)
MGEPPVLTGAAKVTVACASDAIAVTEVGELGIIAVTEKLWLIVGAGR